MSVDGGSEAEGGMNLAAFLSFLGTHVRLVGLQRERDLHASKVRCPGQLLHRLRVGLEPPALKHGLFKPQRNGLAAGVGQAELAGAH